MYIESEIDSDSVVVVVIPPAHFVVVNQLFFRLKNNNKKRRREVKLLFFGLLILFAYSSQKSRLFNFVQLFSSRFNHKSYEYYSLSPLAKWKDECNLAAGSRFGSFYKNKQPMAISLLITDHSFL